MAVLLAVGWFLRRRGVLTEVSQRDLSGLVVSVAFPALILHQLPRTVDAASLAARWFVPVLGAVIIAAAIGAGRLVARFSAAPRQRPVVAFLVGTPNWVFFPLPVAEALYGADGVQCVLLLNVGAQVVFWTLGVWSLRGRLAGRDVVRGLLMNPGLMATLAGTALAVWGGQLGERLDPGVVRAGVGAVSMLGATAVPLSLVVAGTQLGGRGGLAALASREMAGILVGRLLIAPVALVAVVAAARAALGTDLEVVPFHVAYLVAAMPVAVTTAPMVELYGGDASLASRAVVFSTLAGLVSAPAFLALLVGLGL